MSIRTAAKPDISSNTGRKAAISARVQSARSKNLPSQGARRPGSVRRLSGLNSDTSYHYRLVAKNDFGEVAGVEDIFRTYAVESTADTCPNALIRKETGTVLLPDCRAYELVSPANAGGYDVRSDLIPGQVPLAAKPRAADSVLYSLNFGKVPGVARRTDEPRRRPVHREEDGRRLDHHLRRNRGRRPAVPGAVRLDAARGVRRPLDPCLRRPGNLQPVLRGRQDGLAGSPRRRAAHPGHGRLSRPRALGRSRRIHRPAALGRRHPSDLRLDRRLRAGRSLERRRLHLRPRPRHRASPTSSRRRPAGRHLPCPQGAGNCHAPGNADGIASLDVSGDGSRIVVAQRVSTDSAGNRYWHPYMNIDDSQSTVDLAPGTTSGVLYDGMSSDGSSVLYTTVDQLTADDHDTSADIYRADVSPGGALTITRVSQRLRRRRHRFVRPGAGRGPQQLERGRRVVDERLRRRRVRGRGGRRTRAPERSTSSRPRSSTAARASRTSRTSTCRGPGEPARFVATLEPSNPAITRRGPGQRDAQLRRLPGHAERRFRGLLDRQPPDRLPDLRPRRDLPLCGPRATP